MLPGNDTAMSKELTKSEAIEAMENGATIYNIGYDHHTKFKMVNGVIVDGDGIETTLFRISNQVYPRGWRIYEESAKPEAVVDPVYYNNNQGAWYAEIHFPGIPLCLVHGYTEQEAEANARLIVRAVNNHDKLLLALRRIANRDEHSDVFETDKEIALEALKNAEQ